MNRLLVSILAASLLAGCAHHGQTPSAPPKQVDVFRAPQLPQRPYKELRLLTEDNTLGQQGDVENSFIKKAQQMRGDAIIFYPPVDSGKELEGLRRWVTRYVFKGLVVIYTDKAEATTQRD